jgi:hypothetical protein
MSLIGIFIILLMFFFVRKKILQNFYTLIWIMIGFVFIFIALFPKTINLIAHVLGIEFSPIGILVVAIFGLGSIILYLSAVISFHEKKIKEFEKKIAIIAYKKNKKFF